MGSENELIKRLSENGMTQRDFMKYCTIVAKAMGLESSFGPKILDAFVSSERPTLLWLHFSECAGCSEAAFRSSSPWFDELIFDNVSLDCLETLMAVSGSRAEDILYRAASRLEGRFFCVVEGAMPVANGDICGRTGSGAMLSIAQTVCPKASAVIAIGTCAAYGGFPAAGRISTGAKGLKDALGSKLNGPLINLPGCPSDPVSFVGTLASYLLFGRFPELDADLRPLFAYGTEARERRSLHEQKAGRLEDIVSTIPFRSVH